MPETSRNLHHFVFRLTSLGVASSLGRDIFAVCVLWLQSFILSFTTRCSRKRFFKELNDNSRRIAAATQQHQIRKTTRLKTNSSQGNLTTFPKYGSKFSFQIALAFGFAVGLGTGSRVPRHARSCWSSQARSGILGSTPDSEVHNFLEARAPPP